MKSDLDKVNALISKHGGDPLYIRSIGANGAVAIEARRASPIEAMSGEEESEEESEEDTSEERTFSMLAYSGGIANVSYFGRSVFNLKGMETPSGAMPILLEHDRQKIVGFSRVIKKNSKTLEVKGTVLEEEEDGAKVLRSSKRGFPWQASVGLQPKEITYISRDEKIKANGQSFSGPLYLIDSSVLFEASFVSLGADSQTSAIAASRGSEVETVNEEEIRAEMAKRAADIQAAFPNDPAFALKHVAAGSSVLEAKAAYSDVLAQRQAESEERHQKELKELQASKSSGRERNDPIPDSEGSDYSDHEDEGLVYERAVEAGLTRGLSNRKAHIAAARKEPESHREWLMAKNGGAAPEQMKLKTWTERKYKKTRSRR